MKNTFGSALALTIFGESHGRAIGGVLDGMAAGVPVDEEFIAACMDQRRARGDGLSTPRVEADNVQLLSGVVNGHTTGTAIALMIENQNTRSGDYAKTADLLRPGHADFTAYAKYHGFQDARGGGHFSGRITAALVACGAIVLGALNRAGIDITTHIARCAGISDTPFALDDAAALAAQVSVLESRDEGFALLDASVEEPMKTAIRAAGSEGDSVGGILETAILGLPAGVVQGERYKMITKESKKVLMGEFGQTIKPFNPEVQKKAIGDATPITCRPADLIEPQLEKFKNDPVVQEYKQQDEDVLTYALFPQVATDFFKYREAQQKKVDATVADTKNGAYPV